MNSASFTRRMLVWTVLSTAIVGESALAQRAPAANSLQRARSTFDATDLNRDGKVQFEELTKNALPIQRADFAGQDVDKDGSWSREEFVVYYRQLLVNGGQKAADDLEAEVARVLALRKAKAAEAQRKLAAERAAQAAKEPTTVEGRLEAAVDDLEKKIAQGGAAREEFQRVRDLVLDYGKVVESATPNASAGFAARFENALQLLEQRAKDGKYSREEFGALRAILIQKGREAAAKQPQPKVAEPVASAPVAAPVPVEGIPVDVEARLQRALDELAQKAAARGATREDFQRVRDAYSARAKAALQGADPATTADVGGLVDKVYKALDQLEENARAGKWTREEFEAVKKSIFHRARAAVTPDAVPGTDGADGGPATERIEGRFENALTELQKKALARGATREDFQRVKDLLVLRARTAVRNADGTETPDPADPRIGELAARLQAALERIEKDSAAGTVKAEDFATFRQMVFGRVRPTPPEPAPGPATDPTGRAGKPAGVEGGTPPPSANPPRLAPGARAKPAEAKPAEAKPVDPKPVDPKPVDPKPVDPKPSDGKPATDPAPGRGARPPAPAPAPAPTPEPPKDTPRARPPRRI